MRNQRSNFQEHEREREILTLFISYMTSILELQERIVALISSIVEKPEENEQIKELANSILKEISDLREKVSKEFERIRPSEREEREEIAEEKVVEEDPWGIILSTEALIRKVSSTHDVLLPKALLCVIKELHAAQTPEDLRNNVVRHVCIELRDIIHEMLTREPYVGLLKAIKGKDEEELLEEDVSNLRRLVEGFLRGISDRFKDPESGWKNSLLAARFSLDVFDWGGPSVEKRFLHLFYQRMKNLLQRVEKTENIRDKILNAELAIFLGNLVRYFIDSKRFRERLERMKRAL